jgi:hypothetical protein
MVSYKTKKEAIRFLNSRGIEILEVEINNESFFFSVRTFEPPVGGSVSSATFLQFTGVDITDFLEGDVFTGSQNDSYFRRFDDKFSRGENFKFLFSENHTWRLYQ